MDFYIELGFSALISIFVALAVFFLRYNPHEAITHKKLKALYREKDLSEIYQDAKKERTKIKISHKFKVSKTFVQEIQMAGIPMDANDFLLFWATITIAPSFLVGIFANNIIPAIGVALFGLSGPLIYLQKKKHDRVQKFSVQLGDALLTIATSLKAGLTFSQAMQSIAKDMPDPISTEFKRALAEMEYGISQSEALIRVYERMPSEDLRMLISSLAITQKTGGNLSEVVSIISTTIKNRLKIRQEVATMSAQGKMSGMIIGALPLALGALIMVLNPSYINTLLHTDMGHTLIIIAVVLEVMGFAAIQKITDVNL